MSKPKKIKEYTVRVSWTFDGTIAVRAESKKDAVKIVKAGINHPSIDIGEEMGYSSPSVNHEGIVDWNIGLMAKKEHIW